MSRSTPYLLLATLAALALPGIAAPPSNDSCATATPIAGNGLPFTQTVVTTDATSHDDPAVSCVSPAPGKSVWYSFQPMESDAYVFETTGTTPTEYQPMLALYTGNCGALTPVANACASRRLVVPLVGGTTYRLLVAGAPIVVDPSIRIAVDGVDLCPGGAGPGGGACGDTFNVRAGDQISARAYNSYTDTPLTTGEFSWKLGTNANPATATGSSASFTYTAAVASTEVVLTWTPPGQDPMTRKVTMVVGSAVRNDTETPGPVALAALNTTTLPTPGGTLKLTVRRDVPAWRYVNIIPSVASSTSAAGVPFVSDFSLVNLEPSETLVGLELWTASGKRESAQYRVPAGGTLKLDDVVKKAFGLQQTFGSLLIYSTGFVSAGARTWAPFASGGTTGQFLLGGDVTTQTSPAVLETGEVGVLTGVRQDPAFRTNIGVYNLSEKECVVEVDARDEFGLRVGSKLVVTVPPTRYVQEQLAAATGNNLPSGSVAVTNATTGCRVGSVAYVIDNVTQDPFAVSQRKKP